MEHIKFVYKLFKVSKHKRGFLKSVYIYLLEPYIFDFINGVDTRGIIKTEDLTQNQDEIKQNKHYQPTFSSLFKNTISHINFPENSIFADIGCGKGKVLILAIKYGFRNVVGVEFSKELSEIALQNMEITSKKYEFNSKISCVNAKNYSFSDENIIYIYNPFGEEILTSVIINIYNSYISNKRDIYIIYLNPTNNHIFKESGISLYKEIDEGYIYLLKE